MVARSFMVQFPPSGTGELQIVKRVGEAYPGTWVPCAATTGLSALLDLANECGSVFGGNGRQVPRALQRQ